MGMANNSNYLGALVVLNRNGSLNCRFIQNKQSHASSVALHLPWMAVCLLLDCIGKLIAVIG
jgi:hypothetical protein